MHTGRMSQTSTERLREYLAQLPPQAQALLMREFERAIERDEDASVAILVLEQLRKVVRGTEEETQPRTDDPARLVFRPLEPFLVEGEVRHMAEPIMLLAHADRERLSAANVDGGAALSAGGGADNGPQ